MIASTPLARVEVSQPPRESFDIKKSQPRPSLLMTRATIWKVAAQTLLTSLELQDWHTAGDLSRDQLTEVFRLGPLVE